MRFLDSCKIWVQGGNGGNGCLVLPNQQRLIGGHGGAGGDVIAEVVPNLMTLIDYRYKQHFVAGSGVHGQGDNRVGARGNDLVIPMPSGTQILSDDKSRVLVDLLKVGQRHKLAEGGAGGKGGLLPVRQELRETMYNPGETGEGKWLRLQLKLVAEVGVIGMPNTGKSTFIAAISRARTKIAAYPFSTIDPVLATVTFEQQHITFADIPGLIEGSHLGKGLGDYFLRHVERCRVLIQLIDVTEPDVTAAYRLLQNELNCYDTALAKKPLLLALSKTDLVDPSEAAAKQLELQSCTGKPVQLLSSVTEQGVRQLVKLAAYERNKFADQW